MLPSWLPLFDNNVARRAAETEDVSVGNWQPLLILGGNAATAAARITIKGQLDSIGDDAVTAVAALFPDWTPGVKVQPGDVLAWDGTLVECIQAHTAQADWTPDKVPALFRIHRTPSMTAWQPGIAVEVGERFTFGGATWECLQAHTTQQ